MLAMIEPTHGYAAMQQAEESSQGAVTIGPGTMCGSFSTLEKPAPIGQYTFVEGLPMDVVYRLDFINAREKKDEGYWQFFRDAGWKHAGELGGWQYFRKPARPGEPMEIFTDNQSKIAKYNRVR